MNGLIIQSDAHHGIPLADKSVQCIVTSPPYWGLRSYQSKGDPLSRQIGLERDWREWIGKILAVMEECYRVLRDDGVLWLNLGDKYNNDGGYGRGGNVGRQGRTHGDQPAHRAAAGWGLGLIHGPHQQQNPRVDDRSFTDKRIKYKSLIGLPWRVAIAMVDAGWCLRRDVIWHKPSPMPESCIDRPASSHEYVFQFVKGERYFWNRDAMHEPVTRGAHPRGQREFRWPKGWESAHGEDHRIKADSRRNAGCDKTKTITKVLEKRKKRSVWTVASRGFKGNHFATFPVQLIEPMVLSSSRPGDIVLDPFGGAGTVGLVAARHQRRYVLCELGREYAEIAKARISDDKQVRLLQATEKWRHSV